VAVTTTETTCRDLYVTLLKRAILGLTIEDAANLWPEAMGKPSAVAPFDAARRLAGADWPTQAHSMIGEARMDNIRACVERVLMDGVPGDFIETGVWRGGSVIFMRGLLEAHGVSDRRVWVADSFRGLPPPNPAKYPKDKGIDAHQYRELAISLETVKANFARYGLLDDQVRFLEGWFRDTLPTAPIARLALMRLDGDLYESTMDALVALYPKLSVGGVVIVDDFAIGACRAAVQDYRTAHDITDPIEPIDWTGVYWRRTR
jgi:O-methyltransferase